MCDFGSELPEGWSWENLDHLATIDRESLCSETPLDYKFRYIDISAVTTGNIAIPSKGISYRDAPSRARKKIAFGDVLMATVRPNLKAVAVFDRHEDEFIASTGFAVLSSSMNSCSGFIYHSLLSNYLSRQIENKTTGSNYPAISSAKIATLKIATPPFNEQRAIASILDSVDEAIRKTEAVIAKLRQVKTGMLHDLLTCGLDENGELRDSSRHPEQFKDSPLGRIPKEWEINSLGSLIQELGAGVSVNAWDKPVGGREVGVLKTSCVFSGTFFPEENKSVFPRDRGRVSCPVKANSIIISRMNTPLLVGESGYVDADYPDLYLPDRLWQSVMREEKNCSVKWLSYVLNWEPVRKLIRDIATGTSGTMKNISKGGLFAIDIRIPRPVEQEGIANRISSFDKVLAEESKKLTKLNQLKYGLMHDLLTGTIRVPANLLEATP